MVQGASRLQRLLELFRRARSQTPPEREQLLRETRAEDAELAEILAGLLDGGDSSPWRTTSVLQWVRERHADAADFLVTLSELEGAPSHSSAEILERLTKRADSFGRYVLDGELAGGGQGTILRAWDVDLHRKLAMKVMHGREAEASTEDNSRKLSRFLEEAQVTGQLEHPGVVPVHELGVDPEGRIYFTMQLVRGRDLQKVIDLVHAQQETWNLTRALGALIKVCETMAFAHSKGVIHRDLKPANVMIGRFGEVYVMDWGLARVLGREDTHDIRPKPDSGSQSSVVETERQREKEGTPGSPLMTMGGAVLGTPAYMPIEQALGQVEKVDRRSDVYSVGAMLYHLLAGHGPYVPKGARVSQRTVLARVLEGPPEPLALIRPDAPAELVAICEKAMSREQGQRYGDTMEMAEDLEAYLGKRPIRAVAPRLRYVLRLALERNRRVVLTAAGAAALLAVLVIVFILNLTGAVRETNAALRENERLVDVLSAPALIGEFEQLYPLLPATAPRLRAWIERTDALISHRARYEGARGGSFEKLVDELEVLTGLRRRAADNLRIAESLPRDTLEAQREAWDEASASVAQLDTYAGLELTPQLGLVPLGRNTHSGLWEFWHVLSGARPEIDGKSGEPVIQEESGMVLVLLPGGSFAMGSPPSEARRQVNERLHRVALRPFFFSKYEVTQSQWVRTMGDNPSGSPAGLPLVGVYVESPDQEVTPVHPVENVTWLECEEYARRVALQLPTEAQWEYACRAGTTTPFAFGGEDAALDGAENILDRDFASRLHVATSANWDDGFWHHAPVGTFAPNPFGLYDMHGNVSEWCRDVDAQEYPVDSDDPGDGLLPSGDDRRRVFRGGSWYLSPGFCRSAFRHFDFPRSANFSRGVRLARPLDRRD